MSIKDLFFESLRAYATKDSIALLWHDIENHYTRKDRYYHTLKHLQSITEELLPFKEDFSDWTAIVLSVVYHDIIYKATNSDNEGLSASFASKALSGFPIPESTLAQCKRIIEATKSHEVSALMDINLFLDADLSVLGKSWDTYKEYSIGVREEYAIYPDFMYNPGRTKVLRHFLAMPQIYKTTPFRIKYEAIAKENIKMELELLAR
jgi:predicted metal-dependent HD superfamily phosphohydrolase